MRYIRKGAVMLFLLALTGCSKNEAGNDSGAPVPVRFEAGSPEVFKSRTEINTLDDLKNPEKNPNGFGVFAYYTGADNWETIVSSTKPNFMYNQQVTWSSDHWTYTPVKYWPNDNTPADNTGATGSQTHSYVSFFAYAPYFDPSSSPASSPASGVTDIGANNVSGAPTVTYTWAADADLLYDYKKDCYKTMTSPDTYGSVGGSVPFIFKHALAKVEFKARRDNGTLGTITINSLSITSDGATSGTFNLSEATWSSSSAAASPLTSLGGLKTVPIDYNETVSLGSSLMIPRKVTFTHDFRYTIQSIDNDLPPTAISPITLEVGHKYTITFVISHYSVKVETTKYTEQW